MDNKPENPAETLNNIIKRLQAMEQTLSDLRALKVDTYNEVTKLMNPPTKYGERWTLTEKEQAVRDCKDGIPIMDIAKRLGRPFTTTRAVIKKETGEWHRW